ncbi:MAG: histidine kinase [Prolixibacteraceae bacterium]|jgi:LytS/YehU family sensor histidine kinase|nr:histidine kinase [Prolixibacteraceae bacterium]MBT6766998.1 histidine kinase [Prolixibacteraceae bacterium]MBT7000323.1 histidine kinase [Prolixibacteraceae bacterium]MBT7393875.1 histidine kinase [Prolixibacteraceae bacterium]
MPKNKIKNIIKTVITILLLIVIGNVIVLLLVPSSEFTLGIMFSSSIYSILIGGSMGLGIIWIVKKLDRKYPWLKNPVKRLTYQLVYTILYCSIIILITALLMKFNVMGKVSSEVVWQNSLFMIKIAFTFLILSMLITNSIMFFVNWKKSVVLQEQLKREQLDLQYETLKSQVNPHFLFNSLNSVTSLIKKDPDKAILFVKKLSDVYRYVLEQKDNEIVTIESELKFLDSYIFLQKIRFGENLLINVDVADRNKNIIPLSLQMLMENMIKHNVISKEFPLTIDIFTRDKNYLVMKNSLKKKPALSTGNLGIENIRSRFEFFTDKPLLINESETHFTVEIPILN